MWLRRSATVHFAHGVARVSWSRRMPATTGRNVSMTASNCAMGSMGSPLIVGVHVTFAAGHTGGSAERGDDLGEPVDRARIRKRREVDDRRLQPGVGVGAEAADVVLDRSGVDCGGVRLG